MGCFLGCFKNSKDRKRSRKLNKTLPAVKPSHEKESCVFSCPSSSPKEIISETQVLIENSIPKLRENQEQGTVANFRKKVTFDLNVTTFECDHTDSVDLRENDAIEREANNENKDEENEKQKQSTDTPKAEAFPPNHRYQNYESSDDEGLDEERESTDEDEEVDFDDADDICLHGDEESYDSFFSLPIENQAVDFQEVSSPKPTSKSATESRLAIIAKGNARDRSRYIHSVLNPVENLSHWKEVKSQPSSFKDLSKENINLDKEAKSFITPVLTTTCQEIIVEASLSNWLVCSDISKRDPQDSISFLSSSPGSREERPILGALTMDDIKQCSQTSSPKKSPSRSPEEIPIVGTVGGYWSSKSMEESASSLSSGSEKRGIPNTTSKYREDKRVRLFCTPFETRLERALQMEAAGTPFGNVESSA